MIATISGHPVGKASAEAVDCAAARWAGPPSKKQAITRITKAPVLSAAVDNCAPLQNEKPNDYKNRNDQRNAPFESGDDQVSAEDREERAAVFGDDDGDGGGCAAGGKPVAPADDESGVIAEGAAREIVLAAATGNRGAKLRHRGGAGKSIESAENPNSEKHPRIGEKLGDVAGRSNDAGGDGVANRGGHAEPHAEDLEQASAADRGRGADCGRGFRCARQCEVSRDARNAAIISGGGENASRKWRVRMLIYFESYYRGVPTKFHLPQAKDSWTGRK